MAHSAWELDWAELGETRLAIFRCGPPDGIPIIFFHGLGHWALGSWSLIAPHLAGRYHLIALDLPGFGISDKPDTSYDLDYFTAICSAAVRMLAPSGATLVGHSLGGLVAASVAAEYPTFVHRLALINSTGFKISRQWVVQFLGHKLSKSVFNFQPSRWFVRRALISSVYDPRSIDAAQFEHVYESLADPLVRRTFFRIYSAALHEVRDREFIRIPELLGRYRGPVTAIFGSHDPYVPPDVTQRVISVYPHARIEVLETCGHFAQLERPGAVADRIDAMHEQAGFAAS